RRVCWLAAVNRRDQALPARVHLRGPEPALSLGTGACHPRHRRRGPPAAAPRPQCRRRHVGYCRPHPPVPGVPRQVHAARTQHRSRCRRRQHPERRVRRQEGAAL
ncbi:hypothetical protein EV174_005606, partial [Coemansia sp. RSA 2320]